LLQLLLAVHCTQCPAVALHAGVGAEHSLSALHPRHVFVDVSHVGVAPEQSLFVRHATHAPVDVWHLVPLEHCESILQPVHFSVVVSQTGAVFVVHCALVVHATHLPVVVSHAGVAPEQSEFDLQLNGVHGRFEPVASQFGRLGSFAMHLPTRFDHSTCTR
jgi:hypothetical protein